MFCKYIAPYILLKGRYQWEVVSEASSGRQFMLTELTAALDEAAGVLGRTLPLVSLVFGVEVLAQRQFRGTRKHVQRIVPPGPCPRHTHITAVPCDHCNMPTRKYSEQSSSFWSPKWSVSIRFSSRFFFVNLSFQRAWYSCFRIDIKLNTTADLTGSGWVQQSTFVSSVSSLRFWLAQNSMVSLSWCRWGICVGPMAGWGWSQYVPPKRRYPPASPHGVTTVKTNMDRFTAVITSSLSWMQ
jgi:hypothetical protein